MKQIPKTGNIYTLREILEDLDLRDSPFLQFRLNGVKSNIQTGHCTIADLLSIKGFAESEWEFVFETHEWIPIFIYVGNQPITDFIDFKIWIGQSEYWATPKGFPRQQ